MKTDTYHYHLNRTHREDVMRQAHRQHLIHIATERSPKTRRAYAAALLALRRSLFRHPDGHKRRGGFLMKMFAKRVIMLVTLIALVFGSAGVSLAQSLNLVDPGVSEPDHPGFVAYRVGLFYQVRGDHERAIAEFTKTIEGLPTLGYAYAARGDSYAALGDYSRSLADYAQALAIYPDFVSVLYARGQVYLAQGEIELAAVAFADAVGQMPEYALPYAGLGNIAFEQGQYGAALAQYRQYASLVDDVPDALVIERIDRLQTMAAAVSP